METSVSIDLEQIARDLRLSADQASRTVALLDEGNTVAFITRYRKDQTGGLDEEQIRQIQESVTRERLLADRKETILKSIESQGKLTEKLAGKIRSAQSTKRLEDLYLPFKPKKQTLATLARQRGLEPLEQQILEGDISVEELAVRATQFVRVDKELFSVDDVMQGVGHLLAERFGERADLRGRLRKIFWKTGKVVTRATASAEAVTVAEQPANEENNAPQENTESGDSDAAPKASESPAAETQPTTTAESTEVATPDAAKQSKKKSKPKAESAFKDYFEYQEPLTKIPPHRILAINRGEREKVLRVKIEVDADQVNQTAEKLLIPPDHSHTEFLQTCVRDALARLVVPSLEREIRRELTERAERHAVHVFARNLRNLLLQPPVHGRRVLALDPGFRSGCKVAAVDAFGKMLAHDVIHIVGNKDRCKQGRDRLVELIRENDLRLVAIGNGTACRETEELVSDILAEELKDTGVEYVIVNEAGASVYSTSEIGREELPDYDATIRSALSIGRRLLDPLSELVKINAANIGVGMYQHDVKATHLRDSLDDVVESCVNYVGVDVNTASPALLRRVSGLNQLTARRLYEYRQEHGPFKNREALKEVAGFGEVTFVQSAGFLKITGGDNPLDATWIHPESYAVASKVLEKMGGSIGELKTSNDRLSEDVPADAAPANTESPLAQKIAQVDRKQLVQELEIGSHLLDDILTSLLRPGRDPREDIPPPMFRRGIMKLEDLKPGMKLAGTVLNVVDFGAFVDIGLKDTGLVHISRLANRFVGDPHEVVEVGDILQVWVHEIDKDRRRVALTAVEPGTESPPPRREKRGARPAGDRRPRRKKSEQSKGGSSSKRVKPPKYKATKQRRERKPKPVKPITKAMKEGSEPMRSFSDLMQFFEEDKPDADVNPSSEK